MIGSSSFLNLIEKSLQFNCFDSGKNTVIINSFVQSSPYMVVGQVRNNGFSIIKNSGEKYHIKSDWGYCAPFSNSYRSVSDAGIPGTFYWSHIQFSVFGGMDLAQLITFPKVFPPQIGKKIALINTQLLAISKTGIKSLSMLAKRQSLGMQLLELLVQGIDLDFTLFNVQHDKLKRIQNVIQYIHQHITESLEVKSLAPMSHYSLSRFHELFLETTGMSPLQYQTGLRIKQAQMLLLSSASPISTIAEDCGYEDHQYFSRVFKQHVHLSPREYRVQSQNQESVI
jgi:AraC-like DNA-binding protein